MSAYTGVLMLQEGGLNTGSPLKLHVEADSLDELKAKIREKLEVPEEQPMELLVNDAAVVLKDIRSLPPKAKVKVQEAIHTRARPMGAEQPPRGECAKEKPSAGTWPTRFVEIEGNSLNFYDKEGGTKRGSSISSVIGVSVQQGIEKFTLSGQKSWFRVTLERRDHPSQPDLDGGGVTRFAFKSKHDSDAFSAALANMSAGRKWNEDAPMLHSHPGLTAARMSAIAASRLSFGRTSIDDPEVKWMWAGSGVSQMLARKNPLAWATSTASAAEHDLEATKSEPRGVEIRVGASDEINTFADQTEAQTFLQSLQKPQDLPVGRSDEVDVIHASAPQSESMSAVGPCSAELSAMEVQLQVGGKGEFQVVFVSVDPAQISFRDRAGQLLRHAETASATTRVPKSSRGTGHEIALRIDLSKPDSAGDTKHVLSISSAAQMQQLQAALSGEAGSALMSSISEGEDLHDLHEQPVVDHQALLSGGTTCYRPGRIGLSEYTVKMRPNLQGIEFIRTGDGEMDLITGDKLHSCKVSTSGEKVRTQTLLTKKEFLYKLQLEYGSIPQQSHEGDGIHQVYFNTQQECLCFARAIRNIAIGKHGNWSSCEHELDEANIKELHMHHSTTSDLGLTLGLTVTVGAHTNLNTRNCILVAHDDWPTPRRLERAQRAGSRELDPRDLDLGSGVDSQPDAADLAKIKAVFDSLGSTPHDPPQLSLALVEYRGDTCMWAPLSTYSAEEGVPPTEDANEGVPSAGSSSEQTPILSNQSTPSLIIFGEADDAARVKMIQAAQAMEVARKAEEKRREQKRQADEKERKAKEEREAEMKRVRTEKELRKKLRKKQQRRMLMIASCALVTLFTVGLLVYAFIECNDDSGNLTFPGGWTLCEPPPPIDGCMNQSAYNYMLNAETQSDAINCTVAAEITLAGDIGSLLPRGFLDDHFRQDAIDDLQSITHDPSVRIISIRAGSTILTVEIAESSMAALEEAAVRGSASIAGASVLSAAVAADPITFEWRRVDYQGTCGCGQPAVEFERQLTCVAIQCDSAWRSRCVDTGAVADDASCPETTREQAAWVGTVLQCPEIPCPSDPAPPPTSTPGPAPPPTSTPGPSPEPEASCVDVQPTASCIEWAESGRCTIAAENGPWVLENCCATCHVAGRDNSTQTAGEEPCGTWSTLGATYPKCVAIDTQYEESGGLDGGMLALIIIAWFLSLGGLLSSIAENGSLDPSLGKGAGGCTCYLIPMQILAAMLYGRASKMNELYSPTCMLPVGWDYDPLYSQTPLELDAAEDWRDAVDAMSALGYWMLWLTILTLTLPAIGSILAKTDGGAVVDRGCGGCTSVLGCVVVIFYIINWFKFIVRYGRIDDGCDDNEYFQDMRGCFLFLIWMIFIPLIVGCCTAIITLAVGPHWQHKNELQCDGVQAFESGVGALIRSPDSRFGNKDDEAARQLIQRALAVLTPLTDSGDSYVAEAAAEALSKLNLDEDEEFRRVRGYRSTPVKTRQSKA